MSDNTIKILTANELGDAEIIRELTKMDLTGMGITMGQVSVAPP